MTACDHDMQKLGPFFSFYPLYLHDNYTLLNCIRTLLNCIRLVISYGQIRELLWEKKSSKNVSLCKWGWSLSCRWHYEDKSWKYNLLLCCCRSVKFIYSWKNVFDIVYRVRMRHFRSLTIFRCSAECTTFESLFILKNITALNLFTFEEHSLNIECDAPRFQYLVRLISQFS